jgi:hypothetical protein
MIKVPEMSLPLSRLRAGVFTLCIVSACFLANVRAVAADISFEMLTASRSGDLDTVKKLLAQGEDVNAANADGVTALMVAASENRQAVVRALLDADADARMKTASGKTAAFFASGKGNTEVAAILEAAASKPPIVPKVSLLVTADYDCTWKLDGESQGHLASGDSVKVQVELGKHLIEAVTADGVDQYRQVVELTKMQQELVTIGLKSVHDRRLGVARRQAARRAEEARLAEVEADAARGYWTDPSTGLMWALKDNGSDIKQEIALKYCRALSLAGFRDWRLPEIDELAGIWDKSVGLIKGDINMTGNCCLSATRGKIFDFREHPDEVGELNVPLKFAGRTLCVRRAGE